MSAVPDFKRLAASGAALDAWLPDVEALSAVAPALPVKLVRGDQVPFEAVRWLWPGFVPAGMLTVLGGSPGCGKTTIACSLAAILTAAAHWPCGSRCEDAGDVLVWSGEDAPSVLAARFAASGADMSRVHFVDTLATGGPFDPGRHMAELEAAAATRKAPRLLILDPIVSAVAGDSHKAAEVRRSLQPVVAMAQRLGCAVLGVTHFSKGTGGRDPVERVTGSIAFAALARVVLVAAKVKTDEHGDDDADPRRVLMRAKSNIGPDDGGFAYTLERVEVAPEVEGQRVRWLDPLAGTARELLTEADAEPDAEHRSERHAVEQYLEDLLAQGPVTAQAIRSDCEGAGFSWHQVKRASVRIGVVKGKAGLKGGWVWSIPAEGSTKGAKSAVAVSVRPSHSSATPVLPSPAADDSEVF